MKTLTCKLPKHWRSEGANTEKYAIDLDEITPYNDKPSLLIESSDADAEDYFRLYQAVNLTDWHGQSKLVLFGVFKV